VRVQLKDPLKSKQLNKGLDQLSEEGAVQVLRPINNNDQYLGVVGALQFDVVKYRIENEYGVKVVFHGLNYAAARWVHCDDKVAYEAFKQDQGHNLCLDQHDRPVFLIDQMWRMKLLEERHPKVRYTTTSD